MPKNADLRISRTRFWSENLELTRPYTIAYKTMDAVENVFVYVECANGLYGVGAGSPAPYVTGESMQDCETALATHLEAILIGKDIRHLVSICRELNEKMEQAPAAATAVDIALHDILSKYLGLPLVEMLGRAHHSLPTSITIGIKSIEESLAEADEYRGRGFRMLKLKIGKSLDADVELVHKLREHIGAEMGIRVDANQGYDAEKLTRFAARSKELNLELIEQPLPQKEPQSMLKIDAEIRKICAADESMLRPIHALRLAASPRLFGIYNIKLMKCGGVYNAMQIAEIAHLAGIELMWGCMDESIISISAALHAALASPATRYLDLDGSLDLARDLAEGGFILENGHLSVTGQPGLGIKPGKGVHFGGN